jgi:hypothetical protein
MWFFYGECDDAGFPLPCDESVITRKRDQPLVPKFVFEGYENARSFVVKAQLPSWHVHDKPYWPNRVLRRVSAMQPGQVCLMPGAVA